MNRQAQKVARFYAREFYFFAGGEGVTPRAFVEGMISDFGDNCGEAAMVEQGAAFAADASGLGVEAFAAAILRFAAVLRVTGRGDRL